MWDRPIERPIDRIVSDIRQKDQAATDAKISSEAAHEAAVQTLSTNLAELSKDLRDLFIKKQVVPVPTIINWSVTEYKDRLLSRYPKEIDIKYSTDIGKCWTLSHGTDFIDETPFKWHYYLNENGNLIKTHQVHGGKLIVTEGSQAIGRDMIDSYSWPRWPKKSADDYLNEFVQGITPTIRKVMD